MAAQPVGLADLRPGFCVEGGGAPVLTSLCGCGKEGGGAVGVLQGAAASFVPFHPGKTNDETAYSEGPDLGHTGTETTRKGRDKECPYHGLVIG